MRGSSYRAAYGRVRKARKILNKILKSKKLPVKERIAANEKIVQHNNSIRAKTDYRKYLGLQAEARRNLKMKAYETALKKAQEAHKVLIELVNPNRSAATENSVLERPKSDSERKQLLIKLLTTINEAKRLIHKSYYLGYKRKAKEAYDLCLEVKISRTEFRLLARKRLSDNIMIVKRNASVKTLSDFWMYKKRQDKAVACIRNGKFSIALKEAKAAHAVLLRLVKKMPKRKG